MENRRRHWAHLQFETVAVIELTLELAKHPPLVEKLSTAPEADFGSKLALIAMYLNMVVDTVFDAAEDVDAFCELLTQKLMQKRSIVVLPTAGGLH
jgi:hypothetical protein